MYQVGPIDMTDSYPQSRQCAVQHDINTTHIIKTDATYQLMKCKKSTIFARSKNSRIIKRIHKSGLLLVSKTYHHQRKFNIAKIVTRTPQRIEFQQTNLIGYLQVGTAPRQSHGTQHQSSQILHSINIYVRQLQDCESIYLFIFCLLGTFPLTFHTSYQYAPNYLTYMYLIRFLLLLMRILFDGEIPCCVYKQLTQDIL